MGGVADINNPAVCPCCVVTETAAIMLIGSWQVLGCPVSPNLLVEGRIRAVGFPVRSGYGHSLVHGQPLEQSIPPGCVLLRWSQGNSHLVSITLS